MNKFLAQLTLAVLCVPVMGHADQDPEGPKIEITSFGFPSPRSHAGEVCGIVTHAKLPAMVKLEVDYDSDVAATYNAIVGPDGRFCSAVISMKGRVRPSLWYGSLKAEE